MPSCYGVVKHIYLSVHKNYMAGLMEPKERRDSEKIKPIETRKPETFSEKRRREFAHFLLKSVAAALVAVPVTIGVTMLDKRIEDKTEKRVEIRYETARGLPVKKGDLIPLCADGPDGTACYAEIIDVNEKGIALRLNAEVFMDEVTTQTINLDYGRGATFNAGSRIDAITAEKGAQPGEARITVTSMRRSI